MLLIYLIKRYKGFNPYLYYIVEGTLNVRVDGISYSLTSIIDSINIDNSFNKVPLISVLYSVSTSLIGR
jgi:hypothetical protein